MGVHDDLALARLAEDLGEADDRDGAGVDDVGQHLARAHRRQLVDVADEDDRRVRRHGAEQRVHQRHVDHRHLVDDEQVARERVRLLPLEPARLRIDFEQAVDRLRLDAGRLRQPLGRAARWRAQREPDAARRDHGQDRVQQRRLADARAARDYEHLRPDGHPQRLGLHPRQRHRQPRLDPGDRPIRVDRLPGHAARGQTPDARRDDPLGGVQAGQEHARASVHRVPDDRPGLELEVERLRHQRLGDVEQPRGGGHQLRHRQAAMPIVRRLGQRVADARPRANHGRLLDAERGRDLVRGEEADSPDVGGEPVRVLRDDGDGVWTVGLEDPHRARRAHAVRVQEDHDVADRLLLLPGVDDARGARAADAFDGSEPPGLLVDHVEHRGAERIDEAPGEVRADPLDEAGAEVLLDPLDRRRRDRREAARGELQAVDAVVHPRALGLDELADRDRRGVADHRNRFAAAARQDAQHREAVLLVVEGDAFDRARQVVGRRGGGLEQSGLLRVPRGPRTTVAISRLHE